MFTIKNSISDFIFCFLLIFFCWEPFCIYFCWKRIENYANKRLQSWTKTKTRKFPLPTFYSFKDFISFFPASHFASLRRDRKSNLSFRRNLRISRKKSFRRSRILDSFIFSNICLSEWWSTISVLVYFLFNWTFSELT